MQEHFRTPESRTAHLTQHSAHLSAPVRPTFTPLPFSRGTWIDGEARPLQLKAAGGLAGLSSGAWTHPRATPGYGLLGDIPRWIAMEPRPLQLRRAATEVDTSAEARAPGGPLQDTAAQGFQGMGSPLQHLERIQSAFGGHDLSGIRAYTGAEASDAARSMGAKAYAMDGRVAFDGTPDLHTAAHEAAHIVQQRQGVSLKGGVGAAGDPYEVNADAVADRVVAGRSAEDLLPSPTVTAGTARALQRKDAKPPAGKPGATNEPHDAAAVKKAIAEIHKEVNHLLESHPMYVNAHKPNATARMKQMLVRWQNEIFPEVEKFLHKHPSLAPKVSRFCIDFLRLPADPKRGTDSTIAKMMSLEYVIHRLNAQFGQQESNTCAMEVIETLVKAFDPGQLLDRMNSIMEDGRLEQGQNIKTLPDQAIAEVAGKSLKTNDQGVAFGFGGGLRPGEFTSIVQKMLGLSPSQQINTKWLWMVKSGQVPEWFGKVKDYAKQGKLVMLDLGKPHGAKHKVMAFQSQGKLFVYNPSSGTLIPLNSIQDLEFLGNHEDEHGYSEIDAIQLYDQNPWFHHPVNK